MSVNLKTNIVKLVELFIFTQWLINLIYYHKSFNMYSFKHKTMVKRFIKNVHL
jgi:hypothetical protein